MVSIKVDGRTGVVAGVTCPCGGGYRAHGRLAYACVRCGKRRTGAQLFLAANTKVVH
jgi:hypothetical protein